MDDHSFLNSSETGGGENLLVITDEDNGYHYYVTVVDEFDNMDRKYVALIPFEPDDGSHREPEFVIMRVIDRTDRHQKDSHKIENVDITYESIRSKTELNECFDIFLSRLESGKCQTPYYAP